MPLFLQPLARYADFNGRARRAEYWQFWAFQFVVGFALGIVGAGRSNPLALLGVLFWLVMIIPSIAVAVRRFHDTNRTGWWVLFPSGVAFLMTIVFTTVVGVDIFNSLQAMKQGGTTSLSDQAYDAGKMLTSMMLLVFLPTCLAGLVTFIFHVLPGTDGPNRFGDDPKGGSYNIARVFDAPEHEGASAREDAEPYVPVFDFSPAGKTQQRGENLPTRGIPAVRESAPPPQPMRPAPQAFGQARPTFGKRGL